MKMTVDEAIAMLRKLKRNCILEIDYNIIDEFKESFSFQIGDKITARAFDNIPLSRELHDLEMTVIKRHHDEAGKAWYTAKYFYPRTEREEIITLSSREIDTLV